MVWIPYVYQKDGLFDKHGRRKRISVLAEAEAENNLDVGMEVGHTPDKKKERDHRAVDTWDSPVVAIVDPMDWKKEERQDLCSIVAGNCSEAYSETNCCDCDRTVENCC